MCSSDLEDIWTTEFAKRGHVVCPTVGQADCCLTIDGKHMPLSIKTSSSNNPQMAVNWGKNKENINFQFSAPILIIYHAHMSPSVRFRRFQSGIYLTDAPWCQENITFTSNNKTDYVVNSEGYSRMMDRAFELGKIGRAHV